MLCEKISRCKARSLCLRSAKNCAAAASASKCRSYAPSDWRLAIQERQGSGHATNSVDKHTNASGRRRDCTRKAMSRQAKTLHLSLDAVTEDDWQQHLLQGHLHV